MSKVLAVLAVLVFLAGWGLHVLIQRQRVSAAEKHAIAQMITRLLDVQFQVASLGAIFSIVSPDGNTGRVLGALQAFLDKATQEDAVAVLEDALAMLAKDEPIKAHELRTQLDLLPLLENLQALLASNGIIQADLEAIVTPLNHDVVPSINALLLALAEKHSRDMYQQVDAKIHAPLELPEWTYEYYEPCLDESDEVNPAGKHDG